MRGKERGDWIKLRRIKTQVWVFLCEMEEPCEKWRVKFLSGPKWTGMMWQKIGKIDNILHCSNVDNHTSWSSVGQNALLR